MIKDLFGGTDEAYEAKVKELNERMEAAVAANEHMAQVAIEQFKEKADWVDAAGIDTKVVQATKIKELVTGMSAEAVSARNVSAAAGTEQKQRDVARRVIGGDEAAGVELVSLMRPDLVNI